VLEPESRYDRVLYPGKVYLPTHPEGLATCAALRGLRAASPDKCRVLELGCGDGANLVAMALGLPQSVFVGIDQSERATSMGRELAEELGLTNVTFEQADLRALEERHGVFDYVISHGVYSWVPPDAQDALLAACQRHLAPAGIAYISYATYPGAHSRELVREMMLFHAGQMDDPVEKVRRGVEFLRFVRGLQSKESSMAAMLDEELARLEGAAPEYVFHDDFSEYSIPVYFAAFVEHAAAHGLQFLAESHFDFFEEPQLPAPARAAVLEFSAGDPIAEQQYLDFVRGTAFRKTLLCHRDVEVHRKLEPQRLLPLYAASHLRPRSPSIHLKSRTLEGFVGFEGRSVETEEPLAKAAICVLAEVWPEALTVEKLLERAQALAELGPCDDRERNERLEVLAKLVLKLAAFKVLYLTTCPPRFATSAGERPCASALARRQGTRGPFVTSFRHLTVRLDDEPSRALLMLLDGTRNRDDLLVELRRWFDERARSGGEVPELTTGHLDELLARMAAHGLLVA
jgi:cyclopropane fatty-acyl-phospholipid synthase-like methyltransferase